MNLLLKISTLCLLAAITFLGCEHGPSAPVRLGWATYFDASDQSGQSRIHGGIHVPADDAAGRIMGARIGQAAWERAQIYLGR